MPRADAGNPGRRTRLAVTQARHFAQAEPHVARNASA
jgi:hypothetical protein